MKTIVTKQARENLPRALERKLSKLKSLGWVVKRDDPYGVSHIFVLERQVIIYAAERGNWSSRRNAIEAAVEDASRG